MAQNDVGISVIDIMPVFLEYDQIVPLGNQGGQARVFKGVHRTSGKVHVIKVYSHPMLKRAEFEIDTLRGLSCPYIVRLVDQRSCRIRDIDRLCVITEYIDGRDLQSILDEDGPLSEDECIELAKCIGEAVDGLWGARVVHRDIKPGNIRRSDDGKYILIDLGIAKSQNATPMTTAGFVMGTWGYMSPEHAEGRKNLTLRTDLFSLGIVLLEAMLGKHPCGRNQLLVASLNVRSLARLGKVDGRILDVVESLLKPDPSQRPVSGRAIVEILTKEE